MVRFPDRVVNKQIELPKYPETIFFQPKHDNYYTIQACNGFSIHIFGKDFHRQVKLIGTVNIPNNVYPKPYFDIDIPHKSMYSF